MLAEPKHDLDQITTRLPTDHLKGKDILGLQQHRLQPQAMEKQGKHSSMTIENARKSSSSSKSGCQMTPINNNCET